VRLLYVANEPVEGWQRGTRRALDQLVAAGTLDATTTVPLDLRTRQLGSFRAGMEQLCAAATDLQPELILWHHPARLPLTLDDVEMVRSACGNPVLALQEYDAWGAPSKPLDAATRALATAADVVYLCALGPNEAEFRRAGAADVRYTPHTCEHARFAPPPGLRQDPRYDAVMLANNVRRRPFSSPIPGTAERRASVDRLRRQLGDRFGLFGSGWPRRQGSLGRAQFGDQGTVNRLGSVSLGWDHFPTYDFYFSDRLPIALASGVPHVTNRQPGYAELFPDSCGLFLADSVDEMVEMTLDLASLSPAELADIGEAATTFAREHLDTVVVLRKVVGELSELVGR
jgi:hypothetical protein